MSLIYTMQCQSGQAIKGDTLTQGKECVDFIWRHKLGFKFLNNLGAPLHYESPVKHMKRETEMTENRSVFDNYKGILTYVCTWWLVSKGFSLCTYDCNYIKGWKIAGPYHTGHKVFETALNFYYLWLSIFVSFFLESCIILREDNKSMHWHSLINIRIDKN